MWAMRISHEASLHNDNCFITLTYNDEQLPGDLSISKTEIQLFNKRLRNRHGQFRFFAVGEYGNICPTHNRDIGNNPGECRQCNVGRPHYHAILFGTDFPDRELYSVRDGIPLYSSQTLERIWGKGFATIGEVNFETAAYCARYALKKIKGQLAEDHYQVIDKHGELHKLEPEFTLMSRRPGIGKDWYETYVTDIWPSDEVPVPGKGVYKKVPRYYEEQLRKQDETLHADIKKLRQTFRQEHAHDYTPERLMDKYKVKKAQIRQLKRNAQ